ncbi:MAG: hypothetical protein JWO56_3047 [Acidobacteria bacterium]|nr:hypothetical protein [Acidobacteriota bacterium]
MSEFEQQSVLARYKKEYAVLEEQIRLFTERHRALGQVIAGLEALLNIPEAGLSARISEPDEPDVALDRDPLLNAIAILRQDSRPLMAAEVRRRLEDHGIPIKPNTLYVAMVRGVRDGLLVHAYPGFALAERNKE